LAAGPSAAGELIEHVCQQPGTPAAVAEHLALALLGSRLVFTREADGRWSLVASTAPAAIASEPRMAEHASGACASPGDEDRLDRLSYVVVDVETAGGRAQGGDRITEIATVLVRDGQVTEVWEALVNPQRAIPPWITHLTNISWEMVADQPCFSELCDQVLRALSGHVFVAHNATFDWNFV